jgi:hypothetical protein
VAQPRHIPLSQDAALVVTLAGTAMPFAHSAADEAERWLRALRLHGQVGHVLQALGVGEAPLVTEAEHERLPGDGPARGPENLEEVSRRATEIAAAREAETVGTQDLVYAVFDVYGGLFDRALYMRGTSRGELVERLAAAGSPQS